MDTSPRLSTTKARLWTLINIGGLLGIIVNRFGSAESLLGEAGAPFPPRQPMVRYAHTQILAQKPARSLRHSDLCRQSHLLPEALVERRRGNEAPEQADLASLPSCGVAPVWIRNGGRPHDRTCDQLR